MEPKPVKMNKFTPDEYILNYKNRITQKRKYLIAALE